MFSKNVRVIYLYLVALITLGMMIGGSIATISNMADLILPGEYNYSCVDEIKNIIYSVAVIVIACPFFIYHWRKIEKERNATIKSEEVK